MKTDRLLDEFIAFLTPRFAPNRISATGPRDKTGGNGNTRTLCVTAYSPDDKLPSYDPKLLKELNATAEGTKEGTIIRGRFQNTEFEITLAAKRARRPQPV
jgi:hypothetical protein